MRPNKTSPEHEHQWQCLMLRHCVGWGLSGSWEHKQRGQPEPVSQPIRRRAARGTPGRALRASLGLGWTHGWTCQGYGALETRISGAQTSGTKGLEWHHGFGESPWTLQWAVGGLERATGWGGQGMKCLYCPKDPNVSYFIENFKTIKKSLLLQCHLKKHSAGQTEVKMTFF